MNYSIWRLPRIRQEIGLSRATIYRRISEGTFPKPVNLGGRAVGWLESDIECWIRERVNESGVIDRMLVDPSDNRLDQ